MKFALVMAFIVTVAIGYANTVKAAEEGCNESCQQAYTTTMAQEKDLKSK